MHAQIRRDARTDKLLEVCRLRNTPIITFVNKMDRGVREPVELLEEIETVLKIHCADFAYVARLIVLPYAVALSPRLPVKTLAELIA